MLNKINNLEVLLCKYLDDEYNEKNYNYDIIDIIKTFKKNDLIEFITILLYALSENENEMKKSCFYDSFGFWREDIESEKIIISYEKIEEYKNEGLHLKDIINDTFKYKKIILYSFEFGYTDKEYNKKYLDDILKYLDLTKNEIIQIYEEEKTLFFQLSNDDYMRI